MSELALQLIEKEKRERTGKLDLGKCGLTYFPKELFELEWLEELSLCNEFWNYEQRKWIESPNHGKPNNLTTSKIPNDFRLFTELKELRLGGKWKEEWQLKDCEVLENLTSLQTLDLSFNQISDYSFLEKLLSLQTLDLSSNRISDYSFLEKLLYIKTLNLSSNRISDYSFLEKVPSLQTLDLSDNWIRDIHFLEKLPSLQTLDLSGNWISEIRFLDKVHSLRNLYLGYNRISDIRFLKKLTTLQIIDLSNNQISDIHFLEKLTTLQNLYLSRNRINDIRFLEKLTNLQTLDLSHNQISNIRFLEKLTSLQTLDLSQNQIRDIRFLEKLTSLQTLDLSQNQIRDYSFLQKLISLQYIYLSNNQISDIRFLENLTNLQFLNLRDNYISDIRFIENLINLQFLDFQGNQINNIRFLENLITLKFLNLKGNRISNIRFLEKLIDLHTLILSYNQIDDIRALKKMVKLQTLDLDNNHIYNIQFLENLTELKCLNLEKNRITNIMVLLPLLKKNISITYFDNPLINPPSHIRKQGQNAIIIWLEQLLLQGKDQLFEARIVILGESDAGKTTLFKKLKDEKTLIPDPEQKSTHGININNQRIFKHRNRKEVEIKTTIWDFGGQDIQTYLHQYFYAKDNLFILVCDQRSEKTRYDYWFEVITRLCEESRIVVVRNKKERVTASQTLKVDEYQKRFPGLHLSCIDVDLKNTDDHWRSLILTIEENLSELNRVNEVVPRTWKPIREKILELKNLDKPYIRMSEFQTICKNAGLPEEHYQNQCLDYLHWLGYVLHYGDLGLTNTIFIDPQWITTGLYEILREENYKQSAKGRFSQNDIHTIWKAKEYSIEDRNHLLNLLLKDRFEVCYKVENSDNYLVPILISNNKKEPDIQVIKPNILRFKFPFMPFGFFSRLIVRLYENIWDDYVWLTGVWLQDGQDCSALLEHLKDIQTGDEVFEVSIYGSKRKRKELLSVIRNEIYHIKKLLFNNLIIHEQIPCSCKVCEKLPRPYFHNRNELERMIERNQFYSQCKNSGELIPTGQLLDSIIDMEEFKKQIKEMGKSGININLENIGNPQIHLVTQANANASADATATNTVTINIQTILGEVQNLKEDVARELKIKKVPQEEIELLTSDIEVAETALKEIEAAQTQNQQPAAKSTNRLKRFIDDLSDESSTLHKGLKLLRKGKDYGVNLAETYNKVAGNFALPLVPPLALEVIKKL